MVSKEGEPSVLPGQMTCPCLLLRHSLSSPSLSQRTMAAYLYLTLWGNSEILKSLIDGSEMAL